MSGIESKVLSLAKQHDLIPFGEQLVVGVSGGADSVCLLHVLTRYREELGIGVHVAHLNHQLRGAESDGDAKYVADLAGSLGVPITVGKRDVASYRSMLNCSVEEAARELRYDFLAEVAGDAGAVRVAVGHTRDDAVETILMHILRGTGTSGLRGLEACSPAPVGRCGSHSSRFEASTHQREGAATTPELWVIRPLLDLGREEILRYCDEHQLEPRVDSSNVCLSFFRNRIRLELLPLLRKYNPSVDEALLRLAQIASDDWSFIERQAANVWADVSREEGDAVHLHKERVKSLPAALQSRLIRLAVDKVLGDTRDIESRHIQAIRSLLRKAVGRRVSLPRGLMCQTGYDTIAIASVAKPGHIYQGVDGVSQWASAPLFQGESSLTLPGETLLPGWRVLASVGHRQTDAVPSRDGECAAGLVAELDFRKTGAELVVRQRRPGDRFYPLGMSKPKKLQDFMVDAKVPAAWRDHIPVVCAAEQIIWVVGWRIDDRVKVTEGTEEVLLLKFARLPL